MRLATVAALALWALTLSAYPQQPGSGAIAVGVVTAERKPIAQSLDFVGRVEATNRVEVRARLTGYLDAVDFKEGDEVKQGAPLYQIEKGLFQAAVGQAEGALERSKAAKILSEVQLQRAEELLAKLGYTDIVAPIAGKVGKTNVTVGNVVGPDSGPLTLIVSQDPMYVTFPVSQREFLRAQESSHQIDLTGIKARLRFADGRTYDQEGTINFVDVQVNRSTDTVLVRASFPNPHGALIDGQLVRVDLEAGTAQERVLIPQAALIADQEGVYVFVVEDGKAVVKRVKPGGESGTNAVIEHGLSGGELVIVEGLQSVRPGAAVRATPVPATLSRS